MCICICSEQLTIRYHTRNVLDGVKRPLIDNQKRRMRLEPEIEYITASHVPGLYDNKNRINSMDSRNLKEESDVILAFIRNAIFGSDYWLADAIRFAVVKISNSNKACPQISD